MSLKLKEQYCSKESLLGILDEMAERIAEEHPICENLVFIGVLKGGAPIADYLAKRLYELKGTPLPVAYLDISLYREDVIDTQGDPYSRDTEIPFAVKGKEIILVDDVVFTGRTVQSALSSILSFGRPQLVRLAVVVDRGFRELPIHADYVGRHIETTRHQGVRVRMADLCAEPGIFIYEEA